MFKRRLGRSNLEVTEMGLGCWAIGGPWNWLEADGRQYPDGWGQVDDAESLRAIQYALEAGINIFDTAANYGCGQSEKILAQALEGAATGSSWPQNSASLWTKKNAPHRKPGRLSRASIESVKIACAV